MVSYESRQRLWLIRVEIFLGMAGAAAILGNLSSTVGLNWGYTLTPLLIMSCFLGAIYLWPRGSSLYFTGRLILFSALSLAIIALASIVILVLAGIDMLPPKYNTNPRIDASTSWALIGILIVFGTLYFLASREWYRLSWPLVIIYLCVVLIILAACADITASVFENSHPAHFWNSPVFQDLAGIGTLLAACAACVSAWVAARSSRRTPTKDSTYHELVGKLVTKIYDGEVTESERKQLEKLIRSLKKDEKIEAALAKMVADSHQGEDSAHGDSAHQ